MIINCWKVKMENVVAEISGKADSIPHLLKVVTAFAYNSGGAHQRLHGRPHNVLVPSWAVRYHV